MDPFPINANQDQLAKWAPWHQGPGNKFKAGLRLLVEPRN